jgi:O-antigen/teichoic acid export membrane protein
MKLLFLLQWPLLVVLWLFAAEILDAWMGSEVAAAGAPVLRLLALAFFLNAFSQVALAGVQGLGRPDLKAKLDMFEVPFFVLLAALLIPRFGITGAAAAKLVVTVVDTSLLFVFAGRLGRRPMIDWSVPRRHPAAALATATLVAIVALSAQAPVAVRIVVMLVAAGALGGAVWTRALDATDRAAVFGLFRRTLPMKEVTP